MADAPRRIAILGSCVSRDAFDLAAGAEAEVAAYVARCNIAAFGTAAQVDDAILARIASPFQRRMVRHDMAKTGLDELAACDFDILVIDLIDDRLDLQRLGGGHLRTLSDEYRAAAGDLSGAAVIDGATPEHLALWKAGWLRLRDALRARGLMDRAVVNRVFWAGADRADSDRPAPDAVRRANARLAEMYAHIRETTPDIAWITYPRDIFLAIPATVGALRPFITVRRFTRR